MQIKNAIKICCNKIPRGIVIPTDELGYWNINVVFWNASDKRDDETQFDIIPANFDYGIGKCTELEELWKDFCKENGIFQNSVKEIYLANAWYINENLKVLSVVDEALQKYGTDVISVDRNDNDMIDVNICTSRASDYYMLSVARYDKCNIKALEKALDERNVGHCW